MTATWYRESMLGCQSRNLGSRLLSSFNFFLSIFGLFSVGLTEVFLFIRDGVEWG